MKFGLVAIVMGSSGYRVFISHGWADKWVAEQIARRLHDDCGCDTFIDVFDVEKGDDIESRIFSELPDCDELVAILTPWSANRNWVWIEIGAARALNLRIVPVLYGLSLVDLDRERGGKGFLGAKNIVEINDLDNYFKQVAERARR